MERPKQTTRGLAVSLSLRSDEQVQIEGVGRDRLLSHVTRTFVICESIMKACANGATEKCTLTRPVYEQLRI